LFAATVSEAVPDTASPNSSALNNIIQHPDRVDAEFEEFAFVPIGGKAAAGVVVDGVVNGTNGTAEPKAPAFRTEAKYLIGADGANSTVRRLQGITQTNLNFENDWLIVDLVRPAPKPKPS